MTLMQILWNKYDCKDISTNIVVGSSLQAKDVNSILYQISKKEHHMNFVFILLIIT